MMVKYYSCEKCGEKIMKCQLPYCESCLMLIYDATKKVGNNLKSKNNMLIKNQDEEKPAEAGTEEKEEPKEEEKKEETTE